MSACVSSKNNFSEVYVVDSSFKLLGKVPIANLLLAKKSQHLVELMDEVLISCPVDKEPQVAADLFALHRLDDLPLVDEHERLVAVLSHLDVRGEYSSRNRGSEEQGYLQTSVWQHFHNRVYWLSVLSVLGLVSGVIITSYQDVLQALIILAMYMPMVADTGGNAGSQSATVIIRGLALGEVKCRDWISVIWKELRISSVIALFIGGLGFAKVAFLSQGADIPLAFEISTIGMVIGLALALQVVTATIIGAMLPLAVHRCKLDPAVIASPALTTLVDITGMLIYFFVATQMLGIQ